MEIRRTRLAHAAALAVVGWYLMMPPISKTDSGYSADFHAPLTIWTVNRPFDKASDCDTVQGPLVLLGRKRMDKFPNKSLDWALAQQLATSQCISTDDPRLKGN